MSFQSKMIKLRKKKGFTQDTFAEVIGVSRQAVYKWESAASYPEVDKLLKIARLFGVTVDDMLNGDGLRTVLWVSGCDHHCHGCHNPQTWNEKSGLPFDEKAKAELAKENV